MLRNVSISSIIFMSFLSITFTMTSAFSPLSSTIVKFDPSTIELGPDYCVGETFTLTARIDDVSDLMGFGLYIGWNVTYINYIEHTVKVPVETYSDGLLHEPIIIIHDEVNTSEGWYKLAASTLIEPSFYGSGIAFEITFNVTSQPVNPESEATFLVEFTTHEMLSSDVPIPHSTENCSVTILPYWNPADVNDDLKVDIFDVLLCANAYQATPPDPNWNPRCDLANSYDLIDIFDIITIVGSYGEEYQ